MAKGYWIARVDVRDNERYKDYVSTAKPAFERFGANFLARGRHVQHCAKRAHFGQPERRDHLLHD